MWVAKDKLTHTQSTVNNILIPEQPATTIQNNNNEWSIAHQRQQLLNKQQQKERNDDEVCAARSSSWIAFASHIGVVHLNIWLVWCYILHSSERPADHTRPCTVYSVQCTHTMGRVWNAVHTSPFKYIPLYSLGYSIGQSQAHSAPSTKKRNTKNTATQKWWKKEAEKIVYMRE